MSFGDITGDWDYRSLPANICVGRNCWLERKASFEGFRSERDPGLVLGNDVKVYTWSTFNIEPGGYVEVGDESVLVGPVFMCALSIVIGRRVHISYQVTIADSDFHPRDPQLRREDAVANSPYGDRSSRPRVVGQDVIIEDDVKIGIGAIILKGVRIGYGAHIGAGAVVARDVPAHATVAGNPAEVQHVSAG